MSRQPIYDRNGRVFAYELLYRTGESDQAGEMDNPASARALVNSLIDIGLDELVGDKLAFINLPAHLMCEPTILLLPRERVVLEVLETTEFTAEVTEALENLANMGYTLAYDDFTFSAMQVPFLRYVRIVKVDVLASDRAKLVRQIPKLRKMGLQVVAEKVETHEMHETCRNLGCDFFQGYYFAKPQLFTGKGLPSNKALLVQLLARLQDPNITLDEIDQLVTSDLVLSYRLLRFINSAALGMSRRVTSIREAVIFLGISRVGALASLITMSNGPTGTSELLNLAMVRARMCERLAVSGDFEEPSKFFTVGLFSVLDAILGLPMSQIVENLPLRKDILAVLRDEDTASPLAKTLACVKAFERGEFDAAMSLLATPANVNQSYRSAVRWANEARKDLAA